MLVRLDKKKPRKKLNNGVFKRREISYLHHEGLDEFVEILGVDVFTKRLQEFPNGTMKLGLSGCAHKLLE